MAWVVVERSTPQPGRTAGRGRRRGGGPEREGSSRVSVAPLAGAALDAGSARRARFATAQTWASRAGAAGLKPEC